MDLGHIERQEAVNDLPIKVIDIRHFIYDHKEQFQKDVARLNGKLFIFVHPFYNRAKRDYPERPFTSSKRFNARRDALLRGFASHRTPLLVFQEFAKEYALQPALAKVTKDIPGNNDPWQIYLLQTQKDSPYPYVGYDLKRDHWKKVADTLKEAGVRHVVIGGQTLWLPEIDSDPSHNVNYPDDHPQLATPIQISEAKKDLILKASELKEELGTELAANRWLSHNMLPQGCVGGTAVALLREGIDVTISPISSFEKAAEANAGQNLPGVMPKLWYKQHGS